VTEALLEARGAEFAYGHGPPVVKGVELAIRPGASLGIVGESGCGKTTLARMLVGALTPTSGSVELAGRPLAQVARRDGARRRVQMVFQDPYGSLNPRLTARSAVAEVFEVWSRCSRRNALERAEALLADVGLGPEDAARRPGELSGGQCQRAGIARALACEPDILVADEPTSALDVSVQAQILNLLVRLRHERGLALVLVSHDLAVVRYMTEETLVMYRGRIVERGRTDEVFGAPRHPYTRILIDSIPGAEGPSRPVARDLDPSAGCVFAPRCPRAEQDCTRAEPALSSGVGRAYACFHPLESGATG
jgi:oligopeptide/dipeptide ABC transporter ATP-binding protein